MIYLRYRMKLSSKARRDMKAFWAWLEEREKWFYRDLPMVKQVRWFYSVVGDVYVLETWLRSRTRLLSVLIGRRSPICARTTLGRRRELRKMIGGSFWTRNSWETPR